MTKDTPSASSAEAKTIGITSADQKPLPSPILRGAIAETGVAMRPDLIRALDKYRHGEYESAEADLQKLINDLEQQIKRSANESTDPGQHGLLAASAYSVLGQTRQKMNRDEEAQADFQQAIKIFQQWRPTVDRPIGLDLSEFGVALYLSGSKEQAVEVLEASISIGNICPEAYIYLAMSRLEQHHYGEAEELLRKALTLAPDDSIALVALGQALEAQARIDEALPYYHTAAFSLAASHQFDEALARLDHILTIKPDDAKAFAGKAEILRVTGHLEEALQEIDKALTVFPDHPFALAIKGQVLRMQNQNEEAAKLLEQAVALDPTLTWVYAEWGAALCALRRYEEALAALNQAPDVMASDSFALAVKGQVLRMLNQNEEAVKLFQQSVALDPTLTWVYAEWGAALGALERYEEALAALNQAPDLMGSDPFALAVKGKVLHLLNQSEEAVKLFQQSIALDATRDWVYLELGAVLSTLGQNEEALQVLDQALNLNPNNPTVLAFKGETLKNLDHHEEALQLFDQVLALNSDDVAILTNKGECLQALERYQEALDVFNRAQALSPDNAYVKFLRGVNLKELSRYQEALDVFNEVLATLPEPNSMILAWKGRTLTGLTRYEEAADVLRQSIQLDPSLDWAHLEYAFALSSLKRLEEALAALNDGLQHNPDNPSILWYKSLTLIDLSRPEDALEILNHFLTLSPDDLPALELKVDLLEQMDKFDDAVLTLDQALKLDPQKIELWRNKAYDQWSLQHENEALETLEQGLKIVGNHVYLLMDVAVFSQVKDDYDKAFAYVDKALAADPDSSEVLSLKGRLLCDSGEFKLAADVLEQAIKLGAADIDTYLFKGWALENLGPAYYEKALQAYLESTAIDADNLWAQKALGNAYFLLGMHDKADAQYESTLKHLHDQTDLDEETLSLKGWCQYRLKRYDEAMRSFIEALSLDSTVAATQFDLALVMICNARPDLALRAYQQGLDLTCNHHILRQRGLILIALRDLQKAAETLPSLKDIKEVDVVLKLLQEAYDKAYAAVTKAQALTEN